MKNKLISKPIINKSILIQITIAVMCFVTVLRLLRIFSAEPQIDFINFVDFAMAIGKNLNPFDYKNLVLRNWENTLITFPGMTIFFQPFRLFNINDAGFIYLLLNITAAGTIFLWLFKAIGLLDNVDFKESNSNTLIFFSYLFIFCNSSPVLMVLRHGQISAIVCLLMLAVLLCKNKYVNIVWFSFAAALKYSMITTFALALFAKRRKLFCVISFLLFIVICLLPVLWGVNVIELYSRYIEVLLKDIDNGFNTYSGSGYNMLNFSFIKNAYINRSIVATVIIITLAIIFRERKRDEISLNFLFFLCCSSMFISYHRLYDAVLIMALLIIINCFAYYHRDWKNFLVSAGFLIFFFTPFSFVMAVSRYMGSFQWAENNFYLCHSPKMSAIFPIAAVVMCFLTFYSLYLYLCGREYYSFKLFNPLLKSPLPESATAQKQIQLESERLKQKLKSCSILGIVPDFIVILNAERQIIFANQALLEFLKLSDDTSILGLRPDEMLDCVNAKNDSGGSGKTEFYSICNAVNSIIHPQKFHQDSRRGCQIITTHDKAYHFRIWTTPFEIKDYEYTLAIIRNIADEVYRSSLEHIFFHDLINISTGLHGLLNMINGDADAYRKHQQMLIELSNELLEGISSQRDLLAAEQGLMSVQWEQVNSITAMKFAIDALAGNQVADNKHMVLDEKSEAFELQTDSRLLKRILVNMVKNALEASSSGASVVLKCTKNDDKAVFEVHNDGYIEKDVQLQIFNCSFSTKGRGRGLGTYSAKLLAENYLQGRVYFTSTEADGTSFFVKLPLQPEISDE